MWRKNMTRDELLKRLLKTSEKQAQLIRKIARAPELIGGEMGEGGGKRPVNTSTNPVEQRAAVFEPEQIKESVIESIKKALGGGLVKNLDPQKGIKVDVNGSRVNVTVAFVKAPEVLGVSSDDVVAKVEAAIAGTKRKDAAGSWQPLSLEAGRVRVYP
jgi:hypothetical protein